LCQRPTPRTGPTAPERGGQICGAGGGEESDAMCLHSTLRLSLPNWSPSVAPKARQPVPADESEEATAATRRARRVCGLGAPAGGQRFRSRPRQPAVHSSPYAPLLPVRSPGRKRRRRRRRTRARDSAGSTQLSAPLRHAERYSIHATQVAHSARQPAPLGLRRPTVRFAVCLSPRSLIRHDLRWACMFPLIEWHECPPRAEHGYLLTRWRTVKTKKPREHVEACAES
jgi:hypothetical protein